VADSKYVRDYFSDYAAEWLATAYNLEEFPSRYPTGLNRVRISLEIIADYLGGREGQLADLGCGGGDLCVEAARLGIRATGVDVAPGMIEQAQAARKELAPEQAGKLEFFVGDALSTRLKASSFDSVVALGVIEYLPEDSALLAEALRLLKPGGIFIVSCRNRLFNLSSANEYTNKEIEHGKATELLQEAMQTTLAKPSIKEMRKFVDQLKAALPRLEKALELDAGQKGKAAAKPPFSEDRRQHTPDELWRSAEQVGFAFPRFVGVNPHPLPLGFKYAAPRFFAQLARVYETFESLPVSLLWSSAFIGVFSRPES
jgi:SAM-dependent methyltransferase